MFTLASDFGAVHPGQFFAIIWQTELFKPVRKCDVVPASATMELLALSRSPNRQLTRVRSMNSIFSRRQKMAKRCPKALFMVQTTYTTLGRPTGMPEGFKILLLLGVRVWSITLPIRTPIMI
jgi:hypothetical protein